MFSLLLPLAPPLAAGLLAWRAAVALGHPALLAANDNHPLRRARLDPAPRAR